MSRYSDFDDLDLDDEDLPLVEIEFDDEEEDGRSRKAGTVLKVLLIILIVAALLAAGFFVVRYVLGQQSPKIETTSTVTPEPTMGTSSGSSAGTNGSAGADTSNADQTQPGEAASDGDTTETVITTPPTPVLTPTPAPTPKPIPEQYVIPGIDPGDLDAVRAYIQDQLNAMASDVNYPNVDEYTVNEDCTVFTAVCTSLNESAAERGATEKIYEFGRMYAAYAGTTVDNIHIDYRSHMGDLLWTRDSNK
ncbi:MAG: hypothetical protein IJV30_07795 [Oscillospiraceae bacterium]|nr:hypothetical protein [Oscillospiraceae bacterium]